MIIGATCGTRVHAPACSRAAYISAYTGGADLLHLPVQLTADDRVVVASDADGIAERELRELREIDRGAGFTEADGSPFRYPARIETFGMLLDYLPEGPALLVEILGGNGKRLVDKVCATARNRGREADLIVAVHDRAALEACRGRGARAAWAAEGEPPEQVHAVVRPLAQALDASGALTALGEDLAARHARGELPLGAILCAEDSGSLLSAAVVAAVREQAWIHAICVDSVLEAAAVARRSWEWVREPFAATAADKGDVNADLWHLGYAKHNRACHVYVDDGVHVDLAPFTGPLSFPPSGDEVADELHRLRERSWDALRDWPFYGGGGVGFAVGIEGDFAAEVDVHSAVACQATTVEMAAINVDPASHRKPWKPDGSPNLTTSVRDKHSFFDPHGAPPYVGVEHDEDDGWRINWNLGIDYDSNQYGKAFGDGLTLDARMRLERRGNHWSAWYRAIDKHDARDWVCVGGVRNDSMNRRVYLRCVGKRWRQENADKPSEWMPVVANHFVFRDLSIVRFT